MSKDGIFRTIEAPGETTTPDASKLVIYVPPPDDDQVELRSGNIIFHRGPEAGVKVTDPTGVEWDAQSCERLLNCVREFLRSGDSFLQLVDPIYGHPILVHRTLAAGTLMIETSKLRMRKEVQEKTPAGVRVVHGLPPELRKGFRRPG